uniref:Protein E6 n=1 Tax=Eidolon bat papillomavirus TaxID=3141875 RepID=A0AAU7E2G4_9PAPI
MDTQPETINALCALYRVTPDSIELTCISCDRHLDVQEKYRFAVRDIKLVYKEGIPYARCSCCTRAAARLERDNAPSLVPLSLDEIELLEGRSIAQVSLRCTLCLKTLGATEKEAYRRGHFFAIALGPKTYRAVCRLCMVPEGQA